MEFIFLTGIAIVFTFIALIVVTELLGDNTNLRTRIIIDDFAHSLENEFIIAAQVEPGYKREINIPQELEGISYEVSINNSVDNKRSYLLVIYEFGVLEIEIPYTHGKINIGENIIENRNGTVCLNC